MSEPNPTPLTRRQAIGRQRRPRPTPVRTRRRPRPRNRRTAWAAISRIFAVVLLATSAVPAALVGPLAATTSSTAAGTGAPPQTLSVDSTATLATSPRDGYAATTGEELRAAENMRTAATFVNNSDSAVQWPFPVGVPLTDRFGPREAPCSGCSTNHKGLDMTPGEGTPIGVIADGVVIETDESDSGFGVYAKVEHVVNGRTYVSLYAHMGFGSLQVSEGQTVKVGQVIGEVGNSGQSTGPHLHLEIWQDGTDPIDPYDWLTTMVSG